MQFLHGSWLHCTMQKVYSMLSKSSSSGLGFDVCCMTLFSPGFGISIVVKCTATEYSLLKGSSVKPFREINNQNSSSRSSSESISKMSLAIIIKQKEEEEVHNPWHLSSNAFNQTFAMSRNILWKRSWRLRTIATLEMVPKISWLHYITFYMSFWTSTYCQNSFWH